MDPLGAPQYFFTVFGTGRDTRYMARVEGPFPDAPFVPKNIRGLYRSVEHPNVYIGTDESHFGVHDRTAIICAGTVNAETIYILTVNPVCFDEISFEQAVAHELGADIDTSAQVLEFLQGAPLMTVIRETFGYTSSIEGKFIETSSCYHFMKARLVLEKYQHLCQEDDFEALCIGDIDYFEQRFVTDKSVTSPAKIQMWNLPLYRNLNLPFPDAY
jgi:hypothetical protein